MPEKIIEKDAMLIAGLTGKGNETGRLWAAFAGLSASDPLSHKLDGSGYEVRLYSGDGPGEVHVGSLVSDVTQPNAFRVLSLGQSLYAEFEIHPAEGYASQNQAMDAWLAGNTTRFRQSRLGDRLFSVLVYDARFIGDADADSVVACWLPIERVGRDRVSRGRVSRGRRPL